MISAIIPCYNYGHLIADTISSILNQSYQELEVIVIDDGSTDNTEAVVKHIAAEDSRVRYFKFPNTGLGASRNRGIAVAKGDYFQFLDADDLLEPRKFEIQEKQFSRHPEADIVYGSVRYFTKTPIDSADLKFTFWGQDQEWMPKLSGNGHSLLPVALKAHFSHLSSALFSREIVAKVKEFDNEVSAVADYEFLLKCAIHNGFFFYHDDPGSYSLVRWHPDNMSKNSHLMQSHEITMRKKIMPLLEHDKNAKMNNLHAIRNYQLRLQNSWKTKFFSGAKFSKVAALAKRIGMEKFAKSVFYGTLFKSK
ncbi:MAG: glycosyltransferase [Chitinophagaceae bacterium]